MAASNRPTRHPSRRNKAAALPDLTKAGTVALRALSGNAVSPAFRKRRRTLGCHRPDSLEVRSGIHDILAVANGPFARARGDEMAIWQDPRTDTDRVGGVNAATVGVPTVTRDAGLRSYMLSVYNYMASGVLLTGIIAMLFAPYAQQVLVGANGGMSALGWIVTLSPLAIVFAMSFGVNRMSTATLQLLFWAFAALMGLSMSTLFLAFTGASIAQTFFATAAAYLGLSLYGYTTKRDLSGIGTFLIMGVVGLLVAMLINLFLHSSTMALLISGIGVLLFAGLTAYDAQRIKSMYFYVQGTDMMGKTVIRGALTLYLDFINMFQFLLSFMGDRR